MDLPRLALGITCLLSGVATLCAQTPDLSHASLEELMNIKVYTASTYLQTAETAPSLVTVVTADQIRKYGYRTLADILRSVGGFYVTSDRNYSYVGVRGFARPGDYNTRILLLVDGHRLNDSVYGSSFVGFDALLDVDLIERVEIIRGPTSSLYGTNAFLAVVNVIPKTSQQIQGVELSTFLGSFGSYQGRATYGQTAAGIEMLVSATYYTSSGQSLFFPEYSNPTTNNGVARNADDERARNFYGQIGFGKFFLRGAAVSREKGIPTGAFGTVFNNPSTRTFDNFRSFDAQYHAPIARGWELSLRGSYDLYSYDGRYLWSDPTLPDPILNADGCRGEWWGAEASIYHQFPAHNKVTAGLEVRDDFRQDQFSYDVQPYWSYLDDKRKSWMAALYVQDEITLSPKIVLNLGFRHDRYSTFGGTTNPRAALIYQPGRGATLKFLYGTAFRAPSAYELYYRSFIIKNNPRLVPETIRTFELIFEKDLRRHLHMAISGYDNKLGNLINQTADPADGLAFFQNLGRVKSRGAELELTARWLTGLEGRASYSLQRTTDRATGLALSNSPLHMAKLGLIVPVVRNNLFVSLDSWYMSRRRTLSGSSIGGFPVFNSTLLSRNLGKHTEFSAGLYNLFDKNYADPGAEDHMQDALQQDGRNFRVKLTFRF